jgi:hypothetical protein
MFGAAFPNENRNVVGISCVSKGYSLNPKLIDLFETGITVVTIDLHRHRFPFRQIAESLIEVPDQYCAVGFLELLSLPVSGDLS